MVLILAVGCTNRNDTASNVQADPVWQEFLSACRAKDMTRALFLTDSLEQCGMVSAAHADAMRGWTYDQGWQTRIAEHYYHKAFDEYAANPAADWLRYGDAGYRWAFLRYNRGDTEGALGIISDLLAQAEGNEAFSKDVEVSLLMLMADAQIQLHQNDEARHTWQKAFKTYHENSPKGKLPWVSMNISSALFNMGDIEGAQEWLDRCAQEFAHFEQVCTDSILLEEWRGHIALKQARYLQATGLAAEAAAAYAAVPLSRIMEPHSYMEAAEYLMDADRYDEAIYWYELLDSTYLATDGARLSFDNIKERLAPRYVSYRKARLDKKALVFADSICTAIDSALVWEKKSNVAELAIIYQTHEKELRITDLQSRVLLYRVITVASVFIILLIGYQLWRTYKYNKVLAAKNRRLYAQQQQREQEEQQSIKRLQAEPEETLTADQQLFRRLCTLFAEQQSYTDETLNRDTLAQLLGTNAKYVEMAIRECSHGETVYDFITRYRLEHVAHLLKSTDTPVNQVGEQAGIPSRSTLSRLFRNTYGMSCSEYRQAAKGNL